MDLKLITRVQANESLIGHTHKEQLASTVERFCRKYRLPYSNSFTCVFVYGENEDHDAPGAHLGYGLAYRLNEAVVIPKLEIVCTTDIQTAAKNALANEADRNKLNGYLRMFTDLHRLETAEEKYGALVIAVERRTGPYVEARMFEPLSDEDVLGPA